MDLRIKGGSGPTLRAAQRSDAVGEVYHDVVTVLVSGGTPATNVLGDAVFHSYSGAVYYRSGRVYTSGLGQTIFRNLDPEVGTVALDGGITRLSSGIMRLYIEAGPLTIPLHIDLRDVDDEVNQPEAFLATLKGSLTEHLNDQVDSLINNGMMMGTNGLVYSTQDHSTLEYIRNANLWVQADLSSISPWNSNAGVSKAGTMITPRHFIGAAHYEVNAGTQLRCIAPDGTVHNRTVIAKIRHPDFQPFRPDLTVYTLSSDMPASITPTKVMPADHRDYLDRNWFTRPPALGLDQEEKALIIDFHAEGAFRTPVDSDRLIFNEEKISGDSGNPAFLIFNNELVLVTCWTFGGSGSGTAISDYIADINQMIIDADTQAGVSTGYTVTEADFSAWPNFTTQNYILEDSDIANGNASAWVEDGLSTNVMSYKYTYGDGSGWLRVYRGQRVLVGNDPPPPDGEDPPPPDDGDGGEPVLEWIIEDNLGAELAATDSPASSPVGLTFANGYTFSNP